MAYVAVVLPFILMMVLAAVLVRLGGGAATRMLFSALGFPLLTAGMIVAALLFMRIGDRANGMAPSASE
jgi:urea transporter